MNLRILHSTQKSVILLSIVLLLIGCASSKLDININSSSETNGGRPLYVALRFMEEKDFIIESYQNVTEKMFQKSSKTDFVTTNTVYPGTKSEISVDIKEDQKLPLALFFIFLNPADKWKTLIYQPLPKEYDVELGVNEIKKEE